MSGSLLREADGIWRGEASTDVSYPTDAAAEYLDVEERSYWFRHRNACVLELLRAFPPGGPILDVGGGNGIVASAIEANGGRVVLLEPGEEAALNAKRRGIRDVICSSLEDARLEAGSVAAVGLFDVLEHLPDDAGFLTQILRLLANGGRLYVTVPAYPLLWSYEDAYAGHYRRYTSRTLCHRLRAAGFSVEFRSYMFSLLPPAILLGRTVPFLLGVRRRASAADIVRQHTLPSGLLGLIMRSVLKRETRRISARRGLLFGSSCVAVARKPFGSAPTTF